SQALKLPRISTSFAALTEAKVQSSSCGQTSTSAISCRWMPLMHSTTTSLHSSLRSERFSRLHQVRQEQHELREGKQQDCYSKDGEDKRHRSREDRFQRHTSGPGHDEDVESQRWCD